MERKAASTIPFVELYRPKMLDDIVLDPVNRRILENIVDTGYFPNLIVYGQPGTGKTTSVVNLIRAFQTRWDQLNPELVIHLNASDDRGIDVIRSQINTFVSSKTLFHAGTKFVVLDEVDYMTKIAQQALRCLLQTCTGDVRFCLICNYISKIDDGIRAEFIHLHFNALPPGDILSFLGHIVEAERLHVRAETLESIRQMFGSDVRSMINFMQANLASRTAVAAAEEEAIVRVATAELWEQLLRKWKQPKKWTAATAVTKMTKDAEKICSDYHMDARQFLREFGMFIVRHHLDWATPEMLRFFEGIVHARLEDEYGRLCLTLFVHKMLRWITLQR